MTTTHTPPDTLPAGAIIDGEYRYELTRYWSGGARPNLVTVMMLNPSTADSTQDDRTLGRCINFAKRDGYDGLRIINLFALRSTDPQQLQKHPDPIGPLNDAHTLRAARDTDLIVAAWGAHKFAETRAQQVAQELAEIGVRLSCWGTTKAGHPRHPLYVSADSPLTPWELRI